MEVVHGVREQSRKQLVWGVRDKLSTLNFILSDMGETNPLF